MELDDNSLLSYSQYNRAPSLNLQNKHQKEEKEIEAWKEYSRWEIAFVLACSRLRDGSGKSFTAPFPK